jgi:hypothetical protein
VTTPVHRRPSGNSTWRVTPLCSTPTPSPIQQWAAVNTWGTTSVWHTKTATPKPRVVSLSTKTRAGGAPLTAAPSGRQHVGHNVIVAHQDCHTRAEGRVAVDRCAECTIVRPCVMAWRYGFVVVVVASTTWHSFVLRALWVAGPTAPPRFGRLGRGRSMVDRSLWPSRRRNCDGAGFVGVGSRFKLQSWDLLDSQFKRTLRL